MIYGWECPECSLYWESPYYNMEICPQCEIALTDMDRWDLPDEYLNESF